MSQLRRKFIILILQFTARINSISELILKIHVFTLPVSNCSLLLIPLLLKNLLLSCLFIKLFLKTSDDHRYLSDLFTSLHCKPICLTVRTTQLSFSISHFQTKETRFFPFRSQKILCLSETVLQSFTICVFMWKLALNFCQFRFHKNNFFFVFFYIIYFLTVRLFIIGFKFVELFLKMHILLLQKLLVFLWSRSHCHCRFLLPRFDCNFA